MACVFRGWSGLAKSRHSTLSKLIRLRCTESNLTASEDARDPSLQKSEPGAPKSNARIKNELSYHLPTVSLPPKLADSVKEVLKRERIIRVVWLTLREQCRLLEERSFSRWEITDGPSQ